MRMPTAAAHHCRGNGAVAMATLRTAAKNLVRLGWISLKPGRLRDGDARHQGAVGDGAAANPIDSQLNF
jgi:hypothetical protein